MAERDGHEQKDDREWKKGSAELLILSLLEDQQRHGYEISKLIALRSAGTLQFRVTSLYPLLYRLEDRGLIEGRWVEEAGQYPDPGPIDRLFGTMRSAHGTPVQMILTANPGGAGQHWIASRYNLIPFPRGPRLVQVTRPSGITTTAAVIPSRITDNVVLLDMDPGYVDRLRMVGSNALVKAVTDQGLSVDEYSTILQVAQNDAAVRDKLLQRLRPDSK